MKNRRETGGVGRVELWQSNNVRKFLTSIKPNIFKKILDIIDINLKDVEKSTSSRLSARVVNENSNFMTL